MQRKESTMYDYTKSAEELRKFNLNEECHKIAHKYEMFNIEQGVYEEFGKVLLETAKTKYNLEFSSDFLKKYFQDKGIKAPESETFSGKGSDYANCESLRELCPYKAYQPYNTYRSNYYWYTLWRIAKTYNCKSGCVVTQSPRTGYCEEYVFFELDWSKDAVDCITKEKWIEKAEDKSDGWIQNGILRIGCCIAFYFVASVIKGELISAIPFFVGVVIAYIFSEIVLRKIEVKYRMNELSKRFQKHCDNIQNTKPSKYDVKFDTIIQS